MPGYDVSNIIGEKSFGEVVYKRKTFSERILNVINTIKEVKKNFEIDTIYNLDKFINVVEGLNARNSIVHMFADFIIRDEAGFLLLIQKMQYIEENIAFMDGNKIAAIVFCDKENYVEFLKYSKSYKQIREAVKDITYSKLETNSFFYLNDIDNFLQFITSGFEARFFNSLQGNEYIVTKTSKNKKKIKMEYTFYHLIPDDMKKWFVMPYNYVESEDSASYTMERLHMTDVAIRWVHGAIKLEEFEKLMAKLFYFINSRAWRRASRDKYIKMSRELYLDKVVQRIGNLKREEPYIAIAQYIKNSTKYETIDEIVKRYVSLYEEMEEKIAGNLIEVIGHGDLCFSNMLYNKDTYTLKLIDTKGALTEDEMWTNPYYDLAKLSHSICGKYDFFNNGLFDIRVNEKLYLELAIEFDNKEYIQIFRSFLNKNGYDYKVIRVLEVSLFLSMLPLHIDNPQKVLGFILNSINILEEIDDV